MLRAWTHRPRGGFSYLDVNDRLHPWTEPRQALEALLLELFPTPGDLSKLAHYLFGREIAYAMASERSLHLDATDFTRFLDRRGLLDTGFFEQLKVLRPSHALEIDSIAHTYFTPPAR